MGPSQAVSAVTRERDKDQIRKHKQLPLSQIPQETDSNTEIWLQEVYWGVLWGSTSVGCEGSRIEKRENSDFDAITAELIPRGVLGLGCLLKGLGLCALAYTTHWM